MLSRSRLTDPFAVLLSAVAIGVAFERLFTAERIGTNVLLFVVALFVVAALLSHRLGVAIAYRNLNIIAPTVIFLAAMCTVRANGTVLTLNCLTSFFLLLLCAHYWTAGFLPRTRLGSFLIAPFIVFGNILLRAFEPIAQACSRLLDRGTPGTEQTRASTFRRALPVLRGMLIAVPILCVFGALLSSADSRFGDLLHECTASIFNLDDYWPRLVLIAFISWCAAGALTHAITRYENTPEVPTALSARPFGLTEALTVLGSVAALFVLFLGVQFSYLFGGADRALAVDGLNYAHYARRGFWELVCVSLLTGGLIVILREVTRRSDDRAVLAFNMLCCTLIGCTLMLLVSAAQRMMAYEQAMGATELRLIVDIFLVWLAAALLWMAVTLWRWQPHLVYGLLVCAIGYVVTLNVVPLDRCVVDRNVEIYRQTGRLDTEHLSRLGDDGIPALVRAYKQLQDDERHRVGQILAEMANFRKGRILSFPGWNASSATADATLKSLLEAYPELRSFHGSYYD